MKDELKAQFKFITILSVIGIIIAFLFSWIGFSEYIEVSINGHTGGYPFGSVNDAPWYYKNSSVYSYYNLFSCIFFLIGLIFTIIGLVKRKMGFSIIGVIFTFILLLAQQISAGVQL